MNQSPPRPTLEHWILLGILTVLWGSAFAFIKYSVDYLPPAALIFVRLSVAAMVLLAWAVFRGRRMPALTDKRWLWFIGLGFFGNTLPFFLIAWGQQSIDSALAGILIATMPLATLGLAHVFVPGEKMDMSKLGGFLIGFGGVVILMGPAALSGLGGDSFLAQIAVVFAASCYGINAILALPFGVWELSQTEGVTLGAWAAVIWLAVAPTAIASVMLMHIARTAGPGFLAIVNYLTPIAAVITGVIIGETIGWNALLALAVILAGVWLSRRKT